ncbi:MAG: BTB/POZ domain-containing protein [Sphingobacteriales bacterium]|nr:MAG: BTB/POZ domain-containing protein [Sphingobacteriales bacterium]
MMTSGMAETTQAEIQIDADPVLFKHVLDYIYGLGIEVSSTQLLPLLGLCNSYSMCGLRERLATLLESILSVDTCCPILSAADMCGCVQLRDHAFRYKLP